MYQHLNSANSQFDKVMTEDQFNQIVEAIISGKYSWACLLILRFSGYNPLHYIPYRTYNRLMKVHRAKLSQPPANTSSVKDKVMAHRSQSGSAQSSHKSPTKLRDLAYLEDVDRQPESIKGGRKVFSFQGMSNFILHKFSKS